jgi:hypothetical protein
MLSPELKSLLAEEAAELLSTTPASIRAMAGDLSRSAGQPITDDETKSVLRLMLKDRYPLKLIRVNGKEMVVVRREQWARFCEMTQKKQEFA